jgi:hypothetical protein
MHRSCRLPAVAALAGLLAAVAAAQAPVVTTTLPAPVDLPAVRTVVADKVERVPGAERAARPTLYAAPGGKPAGPGTKQAPYDLATVLAGKVVKPGDVVWLLEGIYPAPEREIEVDVKDDRGKATGEKAKARQRLPFVSELRGTPAAPVILRAAPGARVMLDGWMDVNGEHAWYWGFEIADRRYDDSDHKEVSVRKFGVGTSLDVFGPGTRFINLNVHDGEMGFGFWSAAVDSEIYGCAVHDFGHIGIAGGNGHGIVVQNEKGTKRIIDNVLFNGCGWNLHGYSETAPLRDVRIEGNISFSAGILAGDLPRDGYFLAGKQPMDRIVFAENVAYDPRPPARWAARLGGYETPNGSALCRDNYLAGLHGLHAALWREMTLVGNTVWGPLNLLALAPGRDEKGATRRWTVDGNTYIAPDDAKAFNYMTFEEYRRATGFDANSKRIAQPKPVENVAFVRPNRYEAGRAFVAVFNWEGKAEVAVDLARVLTPGDAFEVRNVQELNGYPVVKGLFRGKPVALPMLKSRIAPEFDAFLVTTVPAANAAAPVAK